MNRARSQRSRKHLRLTILSLGLIILGIGIVSWTMLGMQIQIDYAVDTNLLHKPAKEIVMPNEMALLPATHHLITKYIINANGDVTEAFDFFVKTTSGIDVVRSQTQSAGSHESTYVIDVVNEDAYTEYTLKNGGDSDAFGNTKLNSGETKTVPVNAAEGKKLPVDTTTLDDLMHLLPTEDEIKADDIAANISLISSTPKTAIYTLYPKEGDYIGSLTIPALNRELQIYQGTGNNELTKGVGHFMGSVLPGEEDNSVLSGHRETVFRQLDKLKIDDLLIVRTSAGIFTYRVTGMRIVHKDDKTVIVPTLYSVLTITTCYPFYYIGPAPDRYIVSADLVESELLAD